MSRSYNGEKPPKPPDVQMPTSIPSQGPRPAIEVRITDSRRADSDAVTAREGSQVPGSGAVASVDRLKAIEERLAGITPGPWAWEAADGSLLALGTEGTALFEGHVLSCTRCKACQQRDAKCLWPSKPNSDFIASAPDDVRWLLAEVARLSDQLSEYHRIDADRED